MNQGIKTAARVAIPLAIAIISIFAVAESASSVAFHQQTIDSLDEKRTTVLELTAASTAASAAITLIPGDAATPIADKLADLSGYFLLVMCAIFLEKYLLTVTGYAAFTILIPAACLLYSVSSFIRDRAVRQLAKKLLIFGLAIFCVVPASVKISDLIEETYGASIDAAIEGAKDATVAIEENTAAEEETDLLSSFISKVEGGFSDVVAKVETVLNDFIEALAVMIVTSCIIPILVLFFFVWLIKIILGMNISMPKMGDLPRPRKERRIPEISGPPGE